MARQQTQAPRTMTLAATSGQEVVVLFCFGKDPLDHEIGDVCGRWRIFDDETSYPLSHYDLVNLTLLITCGRQANLHTSIQTLHEASRSLTDVLPGSL